MHTTRWHLIQGEGRGRQEGKGQELVLTTAAGLKRDDTGQRDLHEGRHLAGIEPLGLLEQALGCVWEHEVLFSEALPWKDLDGVVTSGLMTGREAEQGVRIRGAAWPGCRSPARILPGSVRSPLLLLLPLPGRPPLIYWLMFVLLFSMGIAFLGTLHEPVGWVKGLPRG